MPSSRSAHALRADPALTAAQWLACGARYGLRDYGILWMGRDDGDGGIEWCGRNVNDEDVGWRPYGDLFVTSLTDVASNGVAIGVATGSSSSSQRLVILTDVADINGDFAVSGADLGELLVQWGQTSTGNPWNAADLDRSGVVGGSDLGALLTRWTGGAVVHLAPPCETWTSVQPLDIEGALRILGFSDAQHFGSVLTELPSQSAVAAAEYVHLVAQVITPE